MLMQWSRVGGMSEGHSSAGSVKNLVHHLAGKVTLAAPLYLVHVHSFKHCKPIKSLNNEEPCFPVGALRGLPILAILVSRPADAYSSPSRFL